MACLEMLLWDELRLRALMYVHAVHDSEQIDLYVPPNFTAIDVKFRTLKHFVTGQDSSNATRGVALSSTVSTALAQFRRRSTVSGPSSRRESMAGALHGRASIIGNSSAFGTSGHSNPLNRKRKSIVNADMVRRFTAATDNSLRSPGGPCNSESIFRNSVAFRNDFRDMSSRKSLSSANLSSTAKRHSFSPARSATFSVVSGVKIGGTRGSGSNTQQSNLGAAKSSNAKQYGSERRSILKSSDFDVDLKEEWQSDRRVIHNRNFSLDEVRERVNSPPPGDPKDRDRRYNTPIMVGINRTDNSNGRYNDSIESRYDNLKPRDMRNDFARMGRDDYSPMHSPLKKQLSYIPENSIPVAVRSRFVGGGYGPEDDNGDTTDEVQYGQDNTRGGDVRYGEGYGGYSDDQIGGEYRGNVDSYSENPHAGNAHGNPHGYDVDRNLQETDPSYYIMKSISFIKRADHDDSAGGLSGTNSGMDSSDANKNLMTDTKRSSKLIRRSIASTSSSMGGSTSSRSIMSLPKTKRLDVIRDFSLKLPIGVSTVYKSLQIPYFSESKQKTFQKSIFVNISITRLGVLEYFLYYQKFKLPRLVHNQGALGKGCGALSNGGTGIRKSLSGSMDSPQKPSMDIHQRPSAMRYLSSLGRSGFSALGISSVGSSGNLGGSMDSLDGAQQQKPFVKGDLIRRNDKIEENRLKIRTLADVSASEREGLSLEHSVFRFVTTIIAPLLGEKVKKYGDNLCHIHLRKVLDFIDVIVKELREREEVKHGSGLQSLSSQTLNDKKGEKGDNRLEKGRKPAEVAMVHSESAEVKRTFFVQADSFVCLSLDAVCKDLALYSVLLMGPDDTTEEEEGDDDGAVMIDDIPGQKRQPEVENAWWSTLDSSSGTSRGAGEPRSRDPDLGQMGESVILARRQQRDTSIHPIHAYKNVHFSRPLWLLEDPAGNLSLSRLTSNLSTLSSSSSSNIEDRVGMRRIIDALESFGSNAEATGKTRKIRCPAESAQLYAYNEEAPAHLLGSVFIFCISLYLFGKIDGLMCLFLLLILMCLRCIPEILIRPWRFHWDMVRRMRGPKFRHEQLPRFYLVFIIASGLLLFAFLISPVYQFDDPVTVVWKVSGIGQYLMFTRLSNLGLGARSGLVGIGGNEKTSSTKFSPLEEEIVTKTEEFIEIEAEIEGMKREVTKYQQMKEEQMRNANEQMWNANADGKGNNSNGKDANSKSQEKAEQEIDDYIKLLEEKKRAAEKEFEEIKKAAEKETALKLAKELADKSAQVEKERRAAEEKERRQAEAVSAERKIAESIQREKEEKETARQGGDSKEAVGKKGLKNDQKKEDQRQEPARTETKVFGMADSGRRRRDGLTDYNQNIEGNPYLLLAITLGIGYLWHNGWLFENND